MSVSMFAGSLIGTLLGFATRNRSMPMCKYFFGKHPVLAQSIGLFVVFGLILIPALALSGTIVISAPVFFWGGCFAYGFIVCFTLASLLKQPRRSRKLSTSRK